MFDFPHPLPEFIERRRSAFEQRVPVHGWFDTAWAAVEQSHADGCLEIADGFRHGGLCHAQERAGLRHAARLHYSEEDMQIAQPKSPADTAVPISSFGDFRRHERS